VLDSCGLRRPWLAPSVLGRPGVVVAGAVVVGAVEVAPGAGALVVPGVAGAEPVGTGAAGAVGVVEAVGVLEPGATVPGWAPAGAGVLVAALDVVGGVRADRGTGMFVPGIVGVAATASAGATSAAAIASAVARRAVASAPPLSVDPCIVADGNEHVPAPSRPRADDVPHYIPNAMR
jgi:hypothetical protein